MRSRLSSEAQLRLRDSGCAEFLRHPLSVGEAAPEVAEIVRNTCRVQGKAGTGSGFFVRVNQELLVVTNAHCVGFDNELAVEWMAGPMLVGCDARPVAIDFAHDLALLQLEESPEDDRGLPLGESPRTGEEVVICGFPFGVETPRVMKGQVSGFEATKTVGGVQLTGITLAAPINYGNSGGPVCREDGSVVGVVFAGPSALNLPPTTPGIGPGGKRLLGILDRSIMANTGLGIAIDTADLAPLLATRRRWHGFERRTYERYASRPFVMSGAGFMALQAQCIGFDVPEDCSPIGVFSFSPPDHLYLGWSTDPERRALAAPPGWLGLATDICYGGGSFCLRGYDVLLYRSKYKGFIVPRRIVIEDKTGGAPQGCSIRREGRT